MNLIRSEWIKLWSVRSHKVMLVIAVAVSLGFALLTAAVVPNDPEQLGPDFSPFALALSGAGIATLLMGAVGVLLVTSEYRYSTFKVTFAAEPRRGRVLVAKVVVGFMAGLLVGAVAVPVALAAALPILSLRDFDVTVGGFSFWRATAGAVLLFGLSVLVGIGLGTVLKSAAAAITLYAILNVLVEPIVGALIDDWARFLPFRAGAEMLNLERADPGLGWPLGLAYFGGWILLLLLLGAWLLDRRDA